MRTIEAIHPGIKFFHLIFYTKHLAHILLIQQRMPVWFTADIYPLPCQRRQLTMHQGLSRTAQKHFPSQLGQSVWEIYRT